MARFADNFSAPNSKTWAGWASLGGTVTSNIAVARNADGRLEIFARGTDSALHHSAQTAPGANTWSAWDTLGGQLASEPGIGINADGRLEAFIWGSDGALYHRWQTTPGGAWN